MIPKCKSCQELSLRAGRVVCIVCDSVVANRPETNASRRAAHKVHAAEDRAERDLARRVEDAYQLRKQEEKYELRWEKRDLARRKVMAMEALARAQGGVILPYAEAGR